jgi:hypothetical protein
LDRLSLLLRADQGLGETAGLGAVGRGGDLLCSFSERAEVAIDAGQRGMGHGGDGVHGRFDGRSPVALEADWT